METTCVSTIVSFCNSIENERNFTMKFYVRRIRDVEEFLIKLRMMEREKWVKWRIKTEKWLFTIRKIWKSWNLSVIDSVKILIRFKSHCENFRWFRKNFLESLNLICGINYEVAWKFCLNNSELRTE